MFVLDDIAAFDRIRISGLMASQVEALMGGLDALSRLKASKQVAEYLAQLGVTLITPKEPLDGFSIADRASASEALDRYLETGLHAVPDALRPFEAMTVGELASTAQLPAMAGRAARVAPIANIEAAQVAAFDELQSRGVNPGIVEEHVLKRLEASREVLAESRMNNPAYAQAMAAIQGVNSTYKDVDAAIRAQTSMVREQIEQSLATRADLAEVLEKRAVMREQYIKDYNAAKAVLDQANKTFDADRAERAAAVLREDGQAVRNAIFAASPISEEQATEWASRQIIDKDALAKLARQGYKREDVYRDIAEFYRMSGGKSSAIRISAGGKRANAVGVETRTDEKVVNLGTHFNKTVLFHELAHHLENDPIAKAASNGFLIKRRLSDKPVSLKQLTGHKYGKHEVAYEDHFISAYTGKVYDDQVTEVFAMGVQYLATPEDSAMFAVRDPQMFAMVTGYLTSALTPAMNAKLNMHSGAIDTLQVARQEQADQYTAAIAALAKRVVLAADSWWEDLQRDHPQESYWVKNEFDRKTGAEYVGSWNGFVVFKGVFKNRNTDRKAKGHLVIRANSVLRMVMDSMPVHGDLSTLKAFLAICADRTLRLSTIWYDVLWDKRRDSKKNLIAAAQSLEDPA